MTPHADIGKTSIVNVDAEKLPHTESLSNTGFVTVGTSVHPQPHTLPSSALLKAYGVNAQHGLQEAEASARLETCGPNRLRPPTRPSVAKIVVRQLGNAMSIVLSKYRTWLYLSLLRPPHPCPSQSSR
jgi:hypothetical protein